MCEIEIKIPNIVYNPEFLRENFANEDFINADLIVLHTEWDEFKNLDFNKMHKNNKLKLYDLRNLYDFEEMKRKKIKYFSVGRPSFNLFQK